MEAFLDRADLFVLPSLTEGLSRALVQAMARGLPAIGSRTGGIVELLSDDQLVTPGDPVALANSMSEILRSPDRLADLSKASVKKARGYSKDKMNEQKLAFWQAIRKYAS